MHVHITDKLKSMQLMQEYKDGHLERQFYDDQSPHKRTGWLRPRVKDVEIQPKLRYAVKSQNERLKDHFKVASLINEEPLDIEMLYRTPYREHNTKKWMSSKPYVTYKGQRERQWSEAKILPDEPEPYVQPTREIERKDNKLKELTRSSFCSSFPKDTWDGRIDRSKSIRSYMSIFAAVKSVSPSTSINKHKLSKIKSNEILIQDKDAPSVIFQEDELAKKGKDVEKFLETLKLMHSPKTAPVVETSLKYSKNKTASTIYQNADELNLHENINKLKSYYKSAQGLIANELSHEARMKKKNNFNAVSLSRCFSEKQNMNHKHSSSMANRFTISQDSIQSPVPFQESSVHMFDNEQQKMYESQNVLPLPKDFIEITSNQQQLPAILENKSTNRSSVRNKINGKTSVALKELLKSNLKNKTIHHKSIIDRYFVKDPNLVKSKK